MHCDKCQDRGINRELKENSEIRRQSLLKKNKKVSMDEVTFELGLGGWAGTLPMRKKLVIPDKENHEGQDLDR